MLPEINSEKLLGQGKWVIFEAVDVAQSSILALPDSPGEDCGTIVSVGCDVDAGLLKKGDFIFVRRAAYEPMPVFKRGQKPRKLFYVHVENIVGRLARD